MVETFPKQKTRKSSYGHLEKNFNNFSEKKSTNFQKTAQSLKQGRRTGIYKKTSNFCCRHAK